MGRMVAGSDALGPPTSPEVERNRDLLGREG